MITVDFLSLFNLFTQATKTFGKILGQILSVSRNPEIGEARERRVSQLFSIQDLLMIELDEIMVFCFFDAVMSRVVRLDDDPTPFVSTSSPTSSLGKELESPFGCSEIREIENSISADDTHKGDIREVMSLNNHLGSNKNVDFL